MESYSDTWNTYDFEDRTSIWVIASASGNNKTGDFELTHAGYWWLVDGAWTSTNIEPDIAPVTPAGEPPHPEVDVPSGSHTTVTEANTFEDLPAVKNLPASIQRTSPYTGSRTDFRDESIYFVMTTRFYDGDPSNNALCWDGANKNNTADPAWRGDFKGLIEKMDYIKALGFTAIWITPVNQNASGIDYHGYHQMSMKKVDKRYESEDVAFIDVLKEAHKRDMKIVLDVVFNHTSNFGEENLFPMFWKYEEDTTINGMLRQNNDLLPANYYGMDGATQFHTRVDSMKRPSSKNPVGHNDELIYHDTEGCSWEQYSEQTGSMAGDCIDLNTENPTVANYIVESFGEFIKMGVDAFRVDTMKHISRLTFNKYIWPGLYRVAERCGANSFHMFGEACTRDRGIWNNGNCVVDSCPFYSWKGTAEDSYAWGTTEKNMASAEKFWNDNQGKVDAQPTSNNAFLNGNSYHAPDHSRWSGTSCIDFPMHWNFYEARNAYNVAKGGDRYYNDPTYNVMYVDSHDYSPDECQTVRYNAGTEAWKENLSLMFTFRGVPCIYYGSEIEFQKGMIIDDGNNTPLDKTGRAYFGDHIEGSVTPTGFGTYTNASGEVASTLNYSLAKHIQKLAKIRLETPALRRGQYRAYGDGMSFMRRYTEGNVDSVACVSISGGCTFTDVPNGTYVEKYSGGSPTVSSGVLNASVSGKGNIQIWVRQ